MIVGDRTPGTTSVELVPDTKTVGRFVARQPGLLGKLVAWLDGFGPGTGEALVRGVVYAEDGTLLGATDEVKVESEQPLVWIDLRFSRPGGCYLPGPGNYDIGLLVGGDPNVARAYIEVTELGGHTNANVYAAGPSDPFGASSPLTTDIAVYGIAVGRYEPPTLADEFYYARLPFFEAQRKFQDSAPDRNSAQPAKLAWHGTSVDAERGSFAVVKLNGKFDDWIGERIQITTWQQKDQPKRSVRCFVHNYADLDSDLSVPRRAWASLAPLGLDELLVTVEKLA